RVLLAAWRDTIMRPVLSVSAALLSVAVFAPAVRAQASVPTRRSLEDVSGPYASFSSSLSFRSPVTKLGPTSLTLQPAVLAPDRGEAWLGGSSSVSEGRNQFGTPVLGKTPLLNRGLGNVGYSRSVRGTRASVRVRVIRLAEEEELQTGVPP